MATPRRKAATRPEATGGAADADGGDANASNEAGVLQSNESSGGKFLPRGLRLRDPLEAELGRLAEQRVDNVEQGSPEASGGDATATGGNGGEANTGNTQEYNGNAYAESESQEQKQSKSLRLRPRQSTAAATAPMPRVATPRRAAAMPEAATAATPTPTAAMPMPRTGRR